MIGGFGIPLHYRGAKNVRSIRNWDIGWLHIAWRWLAMAPTLYYFVKIAGLYWLVKQASKREYPLLH